MTAVNISVGGMLLRTAHTPEIGEKVLLVFSLLETQREIRVTGTVVHARPDVYMGVRFDNLSAEDKEAIDKFVELAVPVPESPAES